MSSALLMKKVERHVVLGVIQRQRGAPQQMASQTECWWDSQPEMLGNGQEPMCPLPMPLVSGKTYPKLSRQLKSGSPEVRKSSS